MIKENFSFCSFELIEKEQIHLNGFYLFLNELFVSVNCFLMR